MEGQAQTQGAYKKRPLWQWVLIYIVLALVAYGLIYFFVMAKRGKNPSYAPNTPTTSDNTNPRPEVKITLTKNGFSPQNVTVQGGATVVWTNESGEAATVNSADHPTHQKFPFLNLGEFADGGTFSVVFNTPGTYGYHDHINASHYGTVVVEKVTEL